MRSTLMSTTRSRTCRRCGSAFGDVGELADDAGGLVGCALNRGQVRVGSDTFIYWFSCAWAVDADLARFRAQPTRPPTAIRGLTDVAEG